MKKIFAVLVFALSVVVIFAQDSTKIKRAAKKAELEKKFLRIAKDRIAVDLLGTNWIYNPNSAGMNGLRTKWYSRGINLYFYWDFRFKRSRVSFAPGFGYSVTNIYSRHELVEDDTTAAFSTVFKPLPEATLSNYKVNKVTIQYIEIPLELRIRSNPDKFNNFWKVAIGVKGGVRVDVHTRQTIKDQTGKKTYVERRFPDFNLFRFGPTIRVGYSVFNVTAYYGVLNVFKGGKGPKANEFSVGISFNGL
ncbi:MAG: outer membrane beta-barrel protein [Bacteroidetes bacterium]|nr:outer membrane beta-barrel protein [Bacteroidota bacterium]